MHSLWEIAVSNSLLVVVLALAVALLGRVWKNPVAMHVLWVLVLLKLVTPPVVTIPLHLPASEPPAVAGKIGVDRNATRPSPAALAKQEEPALASVRSGDMPVWEEATPARLAASPGGGWPAVAKWQAKYLSLILAWIWAVGVATFAAMHAIRIVRFARLLRAAVAMPPALCGVAERIAKQLCLKRVPEIVMLPFRVSPMVWSLGGRPKVILPVELFARWDANAQEAILAHELAHVQRKDHWVRLLELLVSTLFWWHPVVWWACRQLRELEEQCCDGMVVGAGPNGVKTYAAALLDTLDFLSERSVAAPLGATVARSFVSLSRRIQMLKGRSPIMRLTLGRLALLVAGAALPMALAFAAEPPKTNDPSASDNGKSAEKSHETPAIERRTVHKLVTDFPEKVDLSTPESAQAAWNRTSARMDDQAVLELSWIKWGPRDIEKMERYRKDNPKDTETGNEALRNAEILEVATYRGDFAAVITKLNFPEGVGRDPYSSRSFGRINGLWKNLGEDRLPSLEAARENFDRKKDGLWQNYVKVRDSIKSGRPISIGVERPKRSTPTAPGEALGISIEKADLMGRVEWAMMHGMRDITARKTIEWGDIDKDKDGNRTIRYKYYATIWDKDVLIVNQIFTFDAKGNILDVEDVAGFPQKKVLKPVDVSTRKGMQDLVEDFFSKNFRDVTSRNTIEWGDVTKTADGHSSLRYKYRVRIWDKETKIMNQIFTFDAKGEFVSWKNVEGYPQNP